MKKYAPLAGLILILQVLAFLTSYFVTENAVNGWYQSLNKSALTPPDWAFPPVWIILYTILAAALWHLWRGRKNPALKKALVYSLLQLVLNYLWSPVFFGIGAFGAAFIILIAMIAATAAAMATAWNAKRLAAWLMAPYLAWIVFAAWLNYAVMVLN